MTNLNNEANESLAERQTTLEKPHGYHMIRQRHGVVAISVRSILYYEYNEFSGSENSR